MIERSSRSTSGVTPRISRTATPYGRNAQNRTSRAAHNATSATTIPRSVRTSISPEPSHNQSSRAAVTPETVLTWDVVLDRVRGPLTAPKCALTSVPDDQAMNALIAPVRFPLRGARSILRPIIRPQWA